MAQAKKAETSPAPLPDIETVEGRREVLNRAAAGDPTVRSLVTKLLERDLRLGGRLVEHFGNAFVQAVNELTTIGSGKDLAIRECMQRKIEAVRDELAGPNPTPLERILCERVALCWFDAHEMDRRYFDQADITFKNAEHLESRRDRAHKRFLSACKTLATVRKLALPAIQVNLAHQQVNVSGST